MMSIIQAKDVRIIHHVSEKSEKRLLAIKRFCRWIPILNLITSYIYDALKPEGLPWYDVRSGRGFFKKSLQIALGEVITPEEVRRREKGKNTPESSPT